MNRTVTVWGALGIILLAGLLASCAGLPRLPISSRPTDTVTPLPTATETPGPTDTPEPPQNCAYVWSNRSLPEVAILVNQALRDAGVHEADGQASAYGEDCLDPETNTVVGFRTMQTDFFFSVAVPDLTDTQAMGNITEAVLRALDSLPADQIPGPNPGYVGITFDDGTTTSSLWFPRSRGKELLKEDVSGSRLFEALSDAP